MTEINKNELNIVDILLIPLIAPLLLIDYFIDKEDKKKELNHSIGEMQWKKDI